MLSVGVFVFKFTNLMCALLVLNTVTFRTGMARKCMK